MAVSNCSMAAAVVVVVVVVVALTVVVVGLLAVVVVVEPSLSVALDQFQHFLKNVYFENVSTLRPF